ncbi:FAD-binding domain-containing protein [Microthyrium microscopicum]|uniref:FAD-binding domain-containing protein n=1 Tax=Microthyrium microscopicum TaxID=703497 RepID=A0A6A6UED9_9PEZI|nr:FAD-binding domain-containing protein [Microthyrium microscopicum]
MLCFVVSVLTIQVLLGAASPLESSKAPKGCLRLSTDEDFPSAEAWKSALPTVIKNNNTVNVGPDYRIQVKSASDVEKAIKFAKDSNVRLSIITSGHDALARSTAASGLLIDLSLLKGIKVHESFTPTTQGEASVLGQKANVIVPKDGIQAAVTFGAGTTADTLYNALHPSKLFPMTAGHGEVSVAGGWGQFGGHGAFTHLFGLGVDQWLEAKVVTAEGLKIANKLVNPDLFWAIRGGGGGTFGVVVEATMKVYPDAPITGFNWWINATAPTTPEGKKQFEAATAYVLSQLPELHNKGIGGPTYAVAGHALRGFTMHYGNESGTVKANAAWKPVLDKLETLPGMTKFQTRPYNFKNFKEFYDTTFGMEDEMMKKVKRDLFKRHGPGAAGSMPKNYGLAAMDTHLLGADHLKSPKLMEQLSKQGNSWIMIMAAPRPGVGDIEETSVNPSWRKAVVHYVGMGLPSTVRTVAPEMGAYGNEATNIEPNWQEAFWGSNYKKLVDIKTKYDPDHLFWVSPGVKADYMSVQNGRLCKVSSPPAVKATDTAPITDNVTPAQVSVLIERFGKNELIGGFPAPGKYVGLQS